MDFMPSDEKKIAFLERLLHSFGPIAGGLLLDFADLATFGPIGIFAGFFVGIAVASWICSFYRFSRRAKILVSLLAGIYCMVPMTELLPLATLVAASCRFFEEPVSSPTPENSSGIPRKHVESQIVEEDEETDKDTH